MATKLGEAFVKVTTRLRSLRAGLFDARKMVATAARDMGATLTLALSVPLGLMAKRMIEFSGAAEDSEAKFAQVMGSMSASVREWSRELNRAIGISEFMARDVAADFAAILQGSELSREEAAKFSQQLVELAADMRAFRGGRIEEAINAIRSGLSGIVIPLKRFSIDITGLGRSGDKAADSIARIDEILKRADLAGILGQSAREADNFTGVMLKFRGAMDDITTIFGGAFLPAVTKAINLFTKIVTPALKFAGAVLKNTIILKTLVGVLGVLLIVIPPIIFFVGQLALSFISIKASLILLRANTDRYTTSVRTNTRALVANAAALKGLGGAAVIASAGTATAATSTGFFSKVLAGIGLAGLFKWIGGLGFLGTALRSVGLAFRVVGRFIFGPWGLAIFLAIDLIAILWSWLGKTEKQATKMGNALKDAASAASAGFGSAISQAGLAAIASGGFTAAFASPASTAVSTSTGRGDISRKSLGEKLDRIDNTLQTMPLKLMLI